MSNYAVLDSNNVVTNIIVADADFIKTVGWSAILYTEGIFVQIGMYYNSEDGLFYDDAAFTKINGMDMSDTDSTSTTDTTTTA